MNRKLILVTNDDGIFAPGLKALVESVSEFGDVLVVAPDSPQSGMGHAITIQQPLRLNKVEVFPGIESYECSGTPADCVKLAKNILVKNKSIDLCVSGVNHGSNASVNILYSGTLSAAMEASLENIPSIGFSLLDYSFQANFEPAKKYIKSISKYVLDGNLKECNLLNVNIPKLEASEIKGIKICRQSSGVWVEEFQEGIDPRNVKYYWLTGKFVANEDGDDTDLWALANGYVSVVPSGHDLSVHKAILPNIFIQNI